MEGESGGGKIRALIENAINSTGAEVDPRLLKAIKSLVRYSDSDLRIAAHTLMDLLKRDHSQVRYLSLIIIDELFMRSKLFRTLIVEDLDHLLALSVGFRRSLPLPAPPAVASVLRSKAIEFLEKWNDSFGIHYRQIRFGFDYLKNTLRFQFPNIQANAARVQQERREREARSKEIFLRKFDMIKENFSSIKNEIESTVDEIAECLEIVCNRKETMFIGPLDNEEDYEEYRPSELRQIRIDSIREGEKVHEDNENKVIFDSLRELYKLLVTKHLVSVGEWISVLIRVDVEDNRSRDSFLKEFIDIQKRLQSVKKKCVELGCTLPDTTKHEKEDGEDFWEEGKIESGKVENSGAADTSITTISVASSSKGVIYSCPKSNKEESKCSESQGHKQGINDSNPLRNKLLADAPVVTWGSFLDHWGSNTEFLANQRGLELESHWGRVDPDAVIPADKIAELKIHATLYKEEKGEIPPCRAPLRKGGLCQRRDLKVCPFHGPIIPRDDEGNPFHQSTSTSVTAGDSLTSDTVVNSHSVEQLAKQALKNIRDRDNEEAKKRKMDKQLQKRTKLAKIREHNEAVLRDAALASSSNSAYMGEDMEENAVGRSSTRNKKETLASMLRKKKTTKDRLAQRLLNARARDSTVGQLTHGEDAKYREAFPNQW